MPAEVKRVQAGVYLMFLGGNVDEPSLTAAVERASQAAQADNAPASAWVLDPIQLYNPLKVARLLPKLVPADTTHIVLVGNTRSGAVLAERLAQKLPHVTIDATATQPQATNRARDLLGLGPAEAPTCDYL
jgi:electron transfer flavoprotein alpha subunit